MIYARLHVAAPAAPKAEGRGREHPHPTSSPHRQPDAPACLSGRLSVLDKSVTTRAFDTVHLSFRGLIVSAIGVRTALEDIITLHDVKTLADFEPSEPADRHDAPSGRHAAFYFEIPTAVRTASGAARALPLSATTAGITHGAHPTALNDHRIVDGECEVVYWVEAQFRRAGAKVGCLSEPVQLASWLYPRLHAALPRGLPWTTPAKPDLLARWPWQKSPDLAVTLYEPELAAGTPPSRSRRLALPVAVTLDPLPTSLAGRAAAVEVRQSMKCSVDARWEVVTRFSSVPIHPHGPPPKETQVIRHTSHAAPQKTALLLRPLPEYDDRARSDGPATAYVATAQLDLAVPDFVSQPSTRGWDYFSRQYAVHLALYFHPLKGAPKYSVHVRVPIHVSADEAKADDAEKDQAVVVNVAETAGLGDDSDGDAATPVPHAQRRRLSFLPLERAPPPPYFR